MNQMRKAAYAHKQKCLQDAVNSMISAIYALQKSQNELSQAYQSDETLPLLTLLNQCLQELKGIRQNCETLQRRFVGCLSWMS